MSIKIEVEIPEQLTPMLEVGEKELSRQILEALMARFYDMGRISQGRAAELLGVTRYRFLDILKEHHVSPFQETAEELRQAVLRDREHAARQDLGT